MKLKSKKILIPLICVVAVIAMVGVGFAAWTIISPATANDAEGSFVTEELQDRTFTITASEPSANISFGKPAEAVELHNDSWFTHSGDVVENLTATVTLTFDPTGDTMHEDGVDYYLQGRKIKVAIDFLGVPDGEGYKDTGIFNTAETAGHVVFPSLYQTNDKDNNKSAEITDHTWGEGEIFIFLDAGDFAVEGNVATASVTVEFDWGTLTNKENPLKHYNQVTEGELNFPYSVENREEVNALITSVQGLNTAKYKISFQSHTCADGATEDGVCDDCGATISA